MGKCAAVIVFPLIALVLSVACTVYLAVDAANRPRPDKVAWTVAFALFAVAAGAEVAGSLAGWTPWLARTYYLAGAVLVVGFLALGELYLLIPGKISRFAPGLTLLVTALAATLVLDAPIDAARVSVEGWHALEKGPALIGLAVTINALGTLVLAGGAFWSAWQMRERPALRDRAAGLVLIGAGALVVASGGSLTRLGSPQYLYLAMAAGIALIFTGYLRVRKPASMVLAGSEPAARLVTFDSGRRSRVTATLDDPGVALITEWITALDPQAVRERSLEWSATPSDESVLDRQGARSAWALRMALPEHARARFDALPPATRGQLAELAEDVFTGPPRSGAGRHAG
jgi:hypothetical protein